MNEWNFMCHFYSGIVKVDDFRNNGCKGLVHIMYYGMFKKVWCLIRQWT